MARKLTAYNLHVRKEMKAGKSFKQAAASWRGGQDKKPVGGSKNMAKKKGSRKTSTFKSATKRGSKILGSISLKGAILGGLTYFGVSKVMPQIGGIYSPAITKIATGAAAKAVGVPGSILMGAGLIEASAIGIAQLLGGNIPFLSNGTAKNGGGYDY